MYVLSLCVFIVLRINLLNNDTGTRKGKDMWFMISCSKCSSQIDDLNDEWDQLIIDDPCSWHQGINNGLLIKQGQNNVKR